LKATILFLLTLTPLIASDEILWDRELNVNPGASIYLETYKGLVRVETTNGDKVTISARIYMPDGADAPADRVPELLEGLRIDLENTSDSVTLVAKYDESMRKSWGGLFTKSFTQPAVDLVVAIPDTANLEVETYKARIEINAPGGDMKLDTYKGYGFVRGVRGDFRLETYKGTLEVEIDAMRDVEVETYKGDVALSIRGGSDFRIDGHTRKGDLDFRGYDIRREREDKEIRVRHKQGQGTYRIDLDTYKGSIRVDFVE